MLEIPRKSDPSRARRHVLGGDSSPTPKLYPEFAVGGFTRVDGTIAFYTRVNALLTPSTRALDFGAGRGAWTENGSQFAVSLRTLRGKAATVIGVDVDDAVLENPALDEAVVVEVGHRLPFDDESFDLVLSDHTFEHVDDPKATAAELARVVRRGGWICARTPNRWGNVAVVARMVPNQLHARALEWVQPGRLAKDVFPTRYRMNTRRDLKRLFPPEQFRHHVYAHAAEPAYCADNVWLGRLLVAVNSVTPPWLRPTQMIFLHKL